MSFLDAVNERDRILSRFAENHAEYIAGLRAFAREHALRYGTVCIDDVRDAIERNGYPMPKDFNADERLFGSLFTKKEFVPVTARKTRREAFAQRVGVSRSMVTVYELRNKEAA